MVHPQVSRCPHPAVDHPWLSAQAQPLPLLCQGPSGVPGGSHAPQGCSLRALQGLPGSSWGARGSAAQLQERRPHRSSRGSPSWAPLCPAGLGPWACDERQLLRLQTPLGPSSLLLGPSTGPGAVLTSFPNLLLRLPEACSSSPCPPGI